MNLPDWMSNYCELGLCLIPLTKHKIPLVRWKEAGFQIRRPTKEELERWLAEYPGCNWAVVCGSVSGFFFGLDFDLVQNYHRFFEPERIERETTVVRSSRGIHVWGISDRLIGKFDVGPAKERLLEVHGEGSLLIVPPSVHASGVAYQFVNNLYEKGVRKVALFKDAEASIWRQARVLGYHRPASTYHVTGINWAANSLELDRRLTDASRQKIVDAVVPYWTRGRRNKLAMYLSGLFAKRGISKVDAEEVFNAICEATADEERNQRFTTLQRTYQRDPNTLGRLKGITGLREELQDE